MIELAAAGDSDAGAAPITKHIEAWKPLFTAACGLKKAVGATDLSQGCPIRASHRPLPTKHLMPAYAIALIAFLLAVGGLWLGLKLSSRLPRHHLASDSRDSAKVGIGMLATLLALVLGLMITSAKRSFDERGSELVRVSSSIVLLDHALRGFGTGAQPVRMQLRQLLEDIAQVMRKDAKMSPAGLIVRRTTCDPSRSFRRRSWP